MTITVNCPKCAKDHRLRDDLAGQRVKCQGCGSVLQIPSPASTDAADEFFKSLTEQAKGEAATSAEEQSDDTPQFIDENSQQQLLSSDEWKPEIKSTMGRRKATSSNGGLVVSMLVLFIVGMIYVWSGSEIESSMDTLPEEVRNEIASSLLITRVIYTFIITIVLFLLASNWKVFEKAGHAGWMSMIPILNTVVLLRICSKPRWWVVPIASMSIAPLLPLFLLLAAVIAASMESSASMIVFTGLVGLIGIAGIVGSILWIFTTISLSRQFGKGNGFALGLLLLPVVFVPVLGFGNAMYINTPKVA